MTKSGSSGSEGVVGTRRARFNRWRRGRPFAGGVLLILASFVIAWVPIQIAPDIILLGKALSPIFGLLFGAMVFLCGMFALTRPELADIFGIFGVLFSIFSLYGALGGLFVGLVLGIIGGVLCYAWVDEDERDSGGSDGTESETTENEGSDFDFDEDSTEEDSGGLFGSRSVRRATDSSGTHGAGGPIPSAALLVITVLVLGAFVHPLVAAAAQQSFPDEQTGVEGTVIVAEQFSGTFYDHQNVTTDTRTRTGVPAARLSFETADIQGLTMYTNFRSGPQTPFYVKITGTSMSANDLSMTTSEIYFAKLGIGVDPVVIPAARKKWTTCPGEDFLLSVGDLGPLPGPPIDASGVVSNTHRLTASSLTIENFKLTVRKGTKSTTVSGTPECTTNPIEPVLELFTANALELLTDKGVIPPQVVTNGTVTDLAAPANVTQGETFDVSANVTNTGYVSNTTTVEFRFDNETRRTKTITLGPGKSTTVTFADIGTSNVSPGTYTYGVFTGNASATGTITVVNETGNVTNAMVNGTAANTTSVGRNVTSANTTANATTTMAENTTTPTNTTTATNTTPTTNTTTPTNATTDSTPTATTQPTPESTNDTASTIPTATSGSSDETTTAPQTPTTTPEPRTPTTTTEPTTTPEPTATPQPTTIQTATTSSATPTGGTNTTAAGTTTTPTATPTTTAENTTTTSVSTAQPSLRVRR